MSLSEQPTYRFWQTVKGVDFGTGLQEGFSLSETQATSGPGNADNFPRETELREPVLCS